VTKSRYLPAGLLACALLIGLPAAATAQSSITASVETQTLPPESGWTITPWFDVANLWDSNVLFENRGDGIVGEAMSVARPGVALDYHGRRTDVGVRYHGAFVLHHDFRSLNSYDQRVSFSTQRNLTRRTTFFVRHEAAASATTDLTELVGVPFARIGSRLHDFRGGVEFLATRRMKTSAFYQLRAVDFDRVLTGGHSHGATLSIDYALSPRITFTTDVDLHHGTLADGDRFDLQTTWSGLEFALSDNARLFGGAGASRLAPGRLHEEQIGPAWRVGAMRNFRTGRLTVLYNRSFVPSYGIGGTMQNEELSTRLRLPLSRRIYSEVAVAGRRNEPLDTRELALRSVWFDGRIGYSLSQWLRVEAFANAIHQRVARPGGLVDRRQFGLQVTAAPRTRIE
jgi:hypothetical protein